VSNELRKRLLEKDNLELDEISNVAKMLEAVTVQSNQLNKIEVEVNRIKRHFKKQGENTNKYEENRTSIACYKCASPDHLRNDPDCPALNRECKRCGCIGHFGKCCRTRQKKGSKTQNENRQKK